MNIPEMIIIFIDQGLESWEIYTSIALAYSISAIIKINVHTCNNVHFSENIHFFALLHGAHCIHKWMLLYMCVDSSKSKVSTDNVKKIAKIDVQFMKNIPLFKLLKDANLIFKERQPVFSSISKLYNLRITEYLMTDVRS